MNILNKTPRPRKTPTKEEKNYFAQNFAPRETHVIIGKGMKCYHHAGNIMMRDIIASRIHEYAAKTSKRDKSIMLTSILEQIRANGAFVKKDVKTGLWFDACDVLARDKISQAIRKMLSTNKKSKSKPVGQKRFYAKKSEAYWGDSLQRTAEEISTNSPQDSDLRNNINSFITNASMQRITSFISNASCSLHHEPSLSTISNECWNLTTDDNSSISTEIFSDNASLDRIEIFEPMDKQCDGSKDYTTTSASLESDSMSLKPGDLMNIPELIYIRFP